MDPKDQQATLDGLQRKIGTGKIPVSNLQNQQITLSRKIEVLEQMVAELKHKNVKTETWNKFKEVCKPGWKKRVEEASRKKGEELARLLKEEEELRATVAGLKSSVRELSKGVREKEEEARVLAKKVAKLKEGQGPSKNLKVFQTKFLGGKDAVLILPEEVWKLILGNLSDPNDLWNCTNVCRLFEGILHQWKMGWMLEQALPYLYPHLPGSKILECRLFCKDTYSGVNRFLDNHPSLQPHYGNGGGHSFDPRRFDFIHPAAEKDIGTWNAFSFGPDEDLSIFKKLFPNKNPFIGRTLTLELRDHETRKEEEDPELERQRWEKLLQFLEIYGKEIWYLTIYLPHDASDRIEQNVVQLLTLQLFQLAPNMRKLSLKGVIPPVPFAPHLESLGIGNNLGEIEINDPEGIDYSIARSFHSQLRKLRLPAQTLAFVRDVEFPKLAELVLSLPDVDDMDPLYDMDFIQDLSGMSFPCLSKLGVVWEETSILFDFQRMLTAINGLCSTSPLNTLQLNGPHYDDDGEIFGQLDPSLKASSSLKTLEIGDYLERNMGSLFPSNNLLLCFPFIENLNMLLRKESAYREKLKNNQNEDYGILPTEEVGQMVAGLKKVNELVELNDYLYAGEVYKSNVWELMPLLKVFTSQWDVYTREGHRKHGNSRNNNNGN